MEAPHHQMGKKSPRQKDPDHGVLIGGQLGTNLDPHLRAHKGEKDT